MVVDIDFAVKGGLDFLFQTIQSQEHHSHFQFFL